MINTINSVVERAILKLEKLLIENGPWEQQFIENFSNENNTFHVINLKNALDGERKYLQDKKEILNLAILYMKSRFVNETSPILKAVTIFDTATWPTGRSLAEYGNNEIILLKNEFKMTSNFQNIESEQLLDEWYDLKNA